MTDTGSIAPLGHFIRGTKRYLPPFRILLNRRRGGKGLTAPLLVRDGRDTIVGSFTRWTYAFSCLEELHRRNGLVPPHPAVTKRRFEEDIWAHRDKHPHSTAVQRHWNDTVL